jgi:hypothetical protein
VYTWILIGCDVNKDNQIGDMAQPPGSNIQTKSAMGVFRGYVKNIEDKAVYQVEQSKVPPSLYPQPLRLGEGMLK